MIEFKLSSVAEMHAAVAELYRAIAVPAEVPQAIEKAAKAPKAAKVEAPKPVTGVAAPTTTAPETAEATTDAAKAITLEEVRAKLAALSQGGKTAEVKAIISAIGCTKLTDIPADKYAEVLEKAAAL